MVVLFGIIMMTGCAEGKQQDSSSETEALERRPLTVEEAEALMADPMESTSAAIAEMYAEYAEMNSLLKDTTALWNSYGEPLELFAEHFSRDVHFQKRRTQLVEGSLYAPVYYEGALDILPPDSTFFFAAWSDVEGDRATFCVGWLGSEMDKNYTFTRKSDGKWYLTEYFFAYLEDQATEP